MPPKRVRRHDEPFRGSLPSAALPKQGGVTFAVGCEHNAPAVSGSKRRPVVAFKRQLVDRSRVVQVKYPHLPALAVIHVHCQLLSIWRNPRVRILSRGYVQRLWCSGMVNENNRKLHYRASWDVDQGAVVRKGKLGIGATAPGRVRSPDALEDRNRTTRDLKLFHVKRDRKQC